MKMRIKSKVKKVLVKDVRMQSFHIFVVALCTVLLFGSSMVNAEISTEAESVVELLTQQLQQRYPESEIVLKDVRAPIKWEAKEFKNWGDTSLVESKPGRADFRLSKESETVTIKIEFQAFKTLLVSRDRISPKTRLSDKQFYKKRVDVTQPPFKNLRTGFVTSEIELTKYNSTQTLLPNQPLTISSISRIPDVKKGDQLRLELQAGRVRLSSTVELLESGNIDDSVRIRIKGQTGESVARIKDSETVEIRL